MSEKGKCEFCGRGDCPLGVSRVYVESYLSCLKATAARRREREHLPVEREGVVHRFRITDASGVETNGYIRANLYGDGRVGEVFVVIGKAGESSTWADQWAIAVSKLLQRGEPLESVCAQFVAARFEPSGSTSCAEIPRCSSIVDYAARWLRLRFLGVGSLSKEEKDSVLFSEEVKFVGERSSVSVALAVTRASVRHVTVENGPSEPLCGATLEPGDSTVLSALQSDCDACRGVLNIGPVAQRGCAPRPLVDYAPEPWDRPGRDRDEKESK